MRRLWNTDRCRPEASIVVQSIENCSASACVARANTTSTSTTATAVAVITRPRPLGTLRRASTRTRIYVNVSNPFKSPSKLR